MMANEENIRQWTAFVQGPPDSPYEGSAFELRVTVGDEYPLAPPHIEFVTRVFHPNVHFETGEICLDILKKEWSPVWNIQAACRAIMALLAHPEPDSPLNCDAGNMMREGDEIAFYSMARMYAVEFGLRELPSIEELYGRQNEEEDF